MGGRGEPFKHVMDDDGRQVIIINCVEICLACLSAILLKGSTSESRTLSSQSN